MDFDYEDQLGLSFGVTIGVAVAVAFIAWLALVRTGVVAKSVSDYLGEQDGDETKKKESHIQAATPSGDNLDQMSQDVADGQTKPSKIQSESHIAVEMESVQKAMDETEETRSQQLYKRATEKALRGVNEDIHDNMGALETAIQENAEVFDPKTERAFAWLQVCTAALDAFAHGSNDVANGLLKPSKFPLF